MLTAATSLVACGSKDEQTGTAAGAAPKKAPEVRATRVEVAAIHATRSTNQFVRPGEVKGAREAQLASALGGFVERVVVKTGAKVKANTPIAYVDTRTHAAQTRLTKVEVDEAERELARLEKLGKVVASARADTARSRVARAKAQHALSITRQSRAVIRAPFAGVIVDLDVEQGEVVAPGAPVARLLQLDPIHISVSIADRDVAALEVGAKARVNTAGTAGSVEGVIERIEPAADLKTRTFLVEVAVDNAERRLLPGMIAQVGFSSERAGDALFIPQDFVVTKLDGNGVFIVDGTIARWRPLELGGISGTDVEVAKGLVTGERIVVLGHRDLNDGDPLIVAREGRCCEAGRVVYERPSKPAPAKPSEKPDTSSAKPSEKSEGGE